MSRNMYLTVSALGTLVLMFDAGTASAQWLTNWWDPCRCCRPQPCCVQACYQTVPVTEYQEVQQTVQKPIYETKYVDREFTEYRPETEERFAEVPTVNYVTVTENQTCTRDMGQWVTNYQCNPKMAPCQYDPRPGLIGAMSRTGYRIRSAFTPRVTAQRHYVPNVVAYNVPVTRQVAQYGTRKVAYNVTRMVPTTVTRQVAVNTVRYETQVVSRKMPVTVYRQLPIGSAIAYGPISGGSQTAQGPQPDPIGGPRSADKSNDDFDSGSSGNGSGFKRTNPKTSMNETNIDNLTPSSFEAPIAQPVPMKKAAKQIEPTDDSIPEARRTRRVPSIVQVGRWTAARKPTVLDAPKVSGPSMSVADTTAP